MSLSVERLDSTCTEDVERVASIVTKSFSTHNVGSAIYGWDDSVMFDAQVDHLTNEPEIWHGYVAKRDGKILGTAIVVPPGKTASDVNPTLREKTPANIRKWQDETVRALTYSRILLYSGLAVKLDDSADHQLFPKMVTSDEESYGPGGTTPHLYVSLLGVDPEVRKSGAGYALLDHLKAEAKSLGVSLALQSEDNSLIDYYRKAGFRTLKRDDIPISLDGKTTSAYCLICD